MEKNTEHSSFSPLSPIYNTVVEKRLKQRFSCNQCYLFSWDNQVSSLFFLTSSTRRVAVVWKRSCAKS